MDGIHARNSGNEKSKLLSDFLTKPWSLQYNPPKRSYGCLAFEGLPGLWKLYEGFLTP